jgi:hypothetical protein
MRSFHQNTVHRFIPPFGERLLICNLAACVRGFCSQLGNSTSRAGLLRRYSGRSLFPFTRRFDDLISVIGRGRSPRFHPSSPKAPLVFKVIRPRPIRPGSGTPGSVESRSLSRPKKPATFPTRLDDCQLLMLASFVAVCRP